jgi:hypothetical protein
MSKATNKYAPEMRDHASRWAAVVSIAAKTGCAAQTLHEWVKKTEIDRGVRAGVPTEVAAQLKAWNARTVSCIRPTRSCARVGDRHKTVTSPNHPLR